MDTVRFGRVLGHGARQAAKTLVSAVDAATAPHPGQSAATSTTVSPTQSPAPPPPNTQAATPGILHPRPSATPSSPPNPLPRPANTPQIPIPTILPPVIANQAAAQAATTTRGLAEGTRRFGRAVWAPAVRLSGVLWLELTGVFFALFALVAGIAAWRLRPALHASPFAGTSDDHTRLLFAVGMVLVFGYFSFSSFLKANRRSRRP